MKIDGGRRKKKGLRQEVEDATRERDEDNEKGKKREMERGKKT